MGIYYFCKTQNDIGITYHIQKLYTNFDLDHHQFCFPCFSSASSICSIWFSHSGSLLPSSSPLELTISNSFNSPSNSASHSSFSFPLTPSLFMDAFASLMSLELA